MIIYHIEFAKTGLAMSGGETSMVELIKYLKSKKVRNVLLTTDNGRSTYERLGLKEDEYFQYKTLNSFEQEQKYPLIVSYVLRTIDAIRLVRRLKIDSRDILICHSEFFPNAIPFFIMTRQYHTLKPIYWFHMLAPRMFRGFRGEFTGTFQFPNASLIHYRINQWLYARLMSRRGIILTVNNFSAARIKKIFPHNQVEVVPLGAPSRPTLSTSTKIYDLIWIGRFHPQKGLSELLDTLALIKQQKPEIKLVVIGGGDSQTTATFLDQIKQKDLASNVIFKGSLIEDEKYNMLQQAKIFLMTSYYESFGIVILEALSCGLPVVAYDLPVFDFYGDALTRVTLLGNQQMANEVLRLLQNPLAYQDQAAQGYQFSKKYTWEMMGQNFWRIINATRETGNGHA